MSNKEIIAACIRAERARAHISQEELASASGITTTSIAKYELGTMCPSFANAVRIAEVLGCTPNDLCGWKETV